MLVGFHTSQTFICIDSATARRIYTIFIMDTTEKLSSWTLMFSLSVVNYFRFQSCKVTEVYHSTISAVTTDYRYCCRREDFSLLGFVAIRFPEIERKLIK